MCNLMWSKNVNEIVSTHGFNDFEVAIWKCPSMTRVIITFEWGLIQHGLLHVGTPYIYIYTTTGFGPRKNKDMAGVYHFLLYMRTAPKYSSLYSVCVRILKLNREPYDAFPGLC